nr:hypothetical protein [Elizabethkingia sp. ASV34]
MIVFSELNAILKPLNTVPVSYTHLTLPTTVALCISRWSPDH